MLNWRQAGGRRSTAVTLPLGRRFALRYLTEGGSWHDDETAEAFEPNGARRPQRRHPHLEAGTVPLYSGLDIFRGEQGLGRRSDPEQLPGPCGSHGRPTSARGLGS
jgi:hypothetical protein